MISTTRQSADCISTLEAIVNRTFRDNPRIGYAGHVFCRYTGRLLLLLRFVADGGWSSFDLVEIPTNLSDEDAIVDLLVEKTAFFDTPNSSGELIYHLLGVASDLRGIFGVGK